MKRGLKFAIKIGLVALAALLVSACGALLLALEKTPAYSIEPKLTSQQAREATQFIRRVSKKIINAKHPVLIEATASEINDAFTLINRSYSGISGRVDIAGGKARFSLTIRTSVFTQAAYLNLAANLTPAKDRLDWQRGSIGKIALSDWLSRFLFHKTVELMVGKRYGRRMLAGIREIGVSPGGVAILFDPPPGLQAGFAAAAQRISYYSGQNIHFAGDRVQHYLDHLVDVTRSLPKQAVSLSRYLQSLMVESRRQTRQHHFPAERENLSAIYALAIQTAPGAFRHFIADLRVRRLNATHQPRLTLGGREDLAKHFIYSAALHILAQKGVSFSLGETKEIMDADSGGSGFSFADIAADRAGIRFAEIAIEPGINAAILQRFCAAGLREAHFFPPLTGLPEGLSEREFRGQFSDITSVAYQKMLAEIDSRLDRTPILGMRQTAQ